MDKTEFGYRLAKIRQQRGVSAREMSLSIGNCDNYINKIELGKNYPKMDNFFYICDYLGITPEEFFKTDINYPVKMISLIELLNLLNENEIDQITNLAKTLCEYKKKKR